MQLAYSQAMKERWNICEDVHVSQLHDSPENDAIIDEIVR